MINRQSFIKNNVLYDNEVAFVYDKETNSYKISYKLMIRGNFVMRKPKLYEGGTLIYNIGIDANSTYH